MKINSLQTGPLGVNSWIVPLTGPAVMIIDPAACALTGDQNRILDYLSENHLVPVCILLTHGHFDHVPGLPFLKKRFPYIKIAIHEKDSASLGPSSEVHHRLVLGSMYYEDEGLLKSVSNLPSPDVLFKGNEILDAVFDEQYLKQVQNENPENAFDVKDALKALSQWKVLHTPGHSEGSVCYYNSVEKVLISGDTVFYQSYGRTDLTGGSESEIRKSLMWLYKNIPGDTMVYSGHDGSVFELRENI